MAEVAHKTLLGFKYFSFSGVKELCIEYRGTAQGTCKVFQEENGARCGEIQLVPTKEWKKVATEISFADGISPVYLVYEGEGMCDIREISFVK